MYELNYLLIMQEALSIVESNLTGLRKDMEAEQAQRSKVESSLQSSLEELEKIKEDFETVKESFETERAALIQRADAAEQQLAPVTEELAGLKHHITLMTQAIFGKSSIKLLKKPLTRLAAHT
jgi:chromosome segregation ATPase